LISREKGSSVVVDFMDHDIAIHLLDVRVDLCVTVDSFIVLWKGLNRLFGPVVIDDVDNCRIATNYTVGLLFGSIPCDLASKVLEFLKLQILIANALSMHGCRGVFEQV
jgi:hypothetical protein